MTETHFRILKPGREEWAEGFIAIPLMIFIPAHHITNNIALQFNLINSQLNQVSHRIRKTLVYSSRPDYATTWGTLQFRFWYPGFAI